MNEHMRDNYLIPQEGIYAEEPSQQGVRWSFQQASTIAQLRKFRFSRMCGKDGKPLDEAMTGKDVGLLESKDVALLESLADAMTAKAVTPDSDIPAGFTFLLQFVIHALTFDKSSGALAENLTVAELNQGRSPALDLDSLYGRGPRDAGDARFYSDGAHLKVGTTAAVRDELNVFRLSDEPKGLSELEEVNISPAKDQLDLTKFSLDGHDLPRSGFGSTKSQRRQAIIPDARNDQNLGVAQTHLAFIRFHNRMVDELASKYASTAQLFEAARNSVVKHCQWMLWNDLLPLIIDEKILNKVFSEGRTFFESRPSPGSMPTIPFEFAVAAGRFGHSMIRPAYQWNRIYRTRSTQPAWLETLFRYSASGTLSPGGDPYDWETGEFEHLPTNLIPDLQRLYDFGWTAEDKARKPPEVNVAKRIDTAITDALGMLPRTTIVQPSTPEGYKYNLVFRTLMRAHMVGLATGQQLADMMHLPRLTADQILDGDGHGAVLSGLSGEQKDALIKDTPLWFYILREAELNNGRLTGVGGRIVAEVFHRAMEGSRISISRDPFWRPSLVPEGKPFRMVDLLLFAFEGKAELLNPLGH